MLGRAPVTRARVGWQLVCDPVTIPRPQRGCLGYDSSRPNPSRTVTIMF